MRRTVSIVIQHVQGQRQGQRRVIDIDRDIDLDIISYYLSTNTSYHAMPYHFRLRHVIVCDVAVYRIVLYDVESFLRSHDEEKKKERCEAKRKGKGKKGREKKKESSGGVLRYRDQRDCP